MNTYTLIDHTLHMQTTFDATDHNHALRFAFEHRRLSWDSKDADHATVLAIMSFEDQDLTSFYIRAVFDGNLQSYHLNMIGRWPE